MRPSTESIRSRYSRLHVTARHRLTATFLCALLLSAASSLGGNAPAGPSPEAFFGFRMGADDHLADWDGMVRYFTELDRVSDRMAVETVGQTTGKRPYLLATISSPETIASLAQAASYLPAPGQPRHAELIAALRRLFDANAEQGSIEMRYTCRMHAAPMAEPPSAL